jgi:hypothetical protein
VADESTRTTTAHDGTTGSGQGDDARAGTTAHRAAEIDVQRLADRVYALMLAEARLGRARGVSTLGRGVR